MATNGDDIDGTWWSALADGKLLYQLCLDCGTPVFYPRSVCPSCLSSRLEWRNSSGRGTVYSFTVVHKAPDPAMAGETPYAVALIDLDEGFRILAPLTAQRPGPLAVGATVELAPPQRESETVRPYFRLTGGQE